MKRIALFTLALLAACSSDAHSNGAHPGTLTLALAAGGPNDGAVVVVISGGAVTDVIAAAGYEATSNTDAAGTHVMITGDITVGSLATITVPNVSLASAYAVTVEQVADRSTFALLDPLSYQGTLR